MATGSGSSGPPPGPVTCLIPHVLVAPAAAGLCDRCARLGGKLRTRTSESEAFQDSEESPAGTASEASPRLGGKPRTRTSESGPDAGTSNDTELEKLKKRFKRFFSFSSSVSLEVPSGPDARAVTAAAALDAADERPKARNSCLAFNIFNRMPQDSKIIS
jgi:hypothetical protein